MASGNCRRARAGSASGVAFFLGVVVVETDDPA
jgi:hypothetical protein